jgi:hypothetical protein
VYQDAVRRRFVEGEVLELIVQRSSQRRHDSLRAKQREKQEIFFKKEAGLGTLYSRKKLNERARVAAMESLVGGTPSLLGPCFGDLDELAVGLADASIAARSIRPSTAAARGPMTERSLSNMVPLPPIEHLLSTPPCFMGASAHDGLPIDKQRLL